MNKKYKNKLCVYCGKQLATTVDHVWGRGFCLVEHRDNLPQAPACEDCNNKKSTLEQYLMTVLPFGGRHRNAATTFQTMVPRRLERNQKLSDSLRRGYSGDKIPLVPGQIEALFTFVTKGLLWCHFGVLLNEDDRLATTVIRSDGQGFLEEIFSKMKARNRVDVNLGEGTLVYQGLQANDYPQFTIWRFLIYGGLYFSEESKDRSGKHAIIFSVTGQRNPLSQLWQSIFKEELPAA